MKLEDGKQKDISQTIAASNEFTLSWYGWDTYSPVPSNSSKRQIIKGKLEFKQIGINTVKINKKILSDKGIEGEECEARITLSGVSYVRAYYDGTNDTGKIVAGKPVAFDTVTGTSVTGVNEDWAVSEYKVVGIALEDFELVVPEEGYEKDENVIMVKMDAPFVGTPSEITILKTTDYRIPGRFVYNELDYVGMGSAYPVTTVTSTDQDTNGYEQIVVNDSPIDAVLVYNFEVRDIRPDTLLLAFPYKNGFIPVKALF